MPVTTMSSREFNQDSGKAKKAAERGPVMITDRGRPSHVLLSIEEYRKLTAGEKLAVGEMSLAQALAQTEGGDIDFEPPRLKWRPRPAELD